MKKTNTEIERELAKLVKCAIRYSNEIRLFGYNEKSPGDEKSPVRVYIEGSLIYSSRHRDKLVSKIKSSLSKKYRDKFIVVMDEEGLLKSMLEDTLYGNNVNILYRRSDYEVISETKELIDRFERTLGGIKCN